MCEISIIVPVYNVEKYLHKCVDSILIQTFTDFEVILVDDGSLDNSGQICDEYAKKDDRVKVIHKKNGGLSDARNAGIDVAKGKYLGFVDSDDYIERDMYELLYENIVKEKADLSICGIYHVYEGKNPEKKQEKYMLLDRNEAMLLIFHGNQISDHAVNKLYARSIFDTLRYPIGKYHEDSFAIVSILDNCEKIVVDTKQKYYYYHRNDSITSQKFSKKHLEYIIAWEENEKKVKGRSHELDEAAHQRVCFAHFLVLDKILSSNVENKVSETTEIVRYIRKNYLFIMNNKIFTKSRKIALNLLMIHLKLYKILSIAKSNKVDRKFS
ncbi:glycosyltransferase family 2 protein [Enterococcus pallens]|uniref:Glycosyl transferase, group 2 family protein n=1 Tax=Enterococcus pallens ATCC BAA-351 TaxID=1158607 RepID=R2PX77_9ENTE|nr:glycosyltransferase [Enterococcus pallens]EOH87788.1 glycosyl transferase, group 2 family protein [Enterococcus pallens ATCC BAA-351]EOU18002.1 glycosyl transferase, group 2 family protein [Enterococcus pallens ATCC BAA-351]OJG82374.1 glycosyl transferase, group 2 family protein [Enterococcus pallens]